MQHVSAESGFGLRQHGLYLHCTLLLKVRWLLRISMWFAAGLLGGDVEAGVGDWRLPSRLCIDGLGCDGWGT